MRGRSTVPSLAGGILSVLIFTVILLYSTLKFMHLMQRHNPTVASFVEPNVFDSSDVFNFRDQGLRFAFGVEGYLDKQLKDDPRYVKITTRIYGHRDGERFEQFIPVHYCTKEDLDEFPAPVENSQSLFTAYRNDPDRNIFCLDWDSYGDVLEIWGTEDNEVDYQRFEFILHPCNYLHADLGPTDDSVSENCVADRDQQMTYLTNMKLVFLTTEQAFNQREYGERAITTHSRIMTQQVDQNIPTWINGRLNMNELEDEIAYLQYGQAAESDFYSYTMSNNIPSSWNTWPSPENLNARYKYVSIEYNMNLDKMNWTRSTYSLLDWLGDLGGLMDILLKIGSLMTEPMAHFTLQVTLMTSLFRFKSSQSTDSPQELDEGEATSFAKQQEAIRREFAASKRIPYLYYWRVYFLCCEKEKTRRYRDTIRKSVIRLEKEMDLQKFLHRQRVYLTSLLGLLKGSQSQFVDKFSQLVICESSDQEETSSDEELSDWGERPINFIERMQLSKDRVDSNLLSIFRIRQVEQKKEHIASNSKIALQHSQSSISQTQLADLNQGRGRFDDQQLLKPHSKLVRKKIKDTTTASHSLDTPVADLNLNSRSRENKRMMSLPVTEDYAERDGGNAQNREVAGSVQIKQNLRIFLALQPVPEYQASQRD